MKEKFTFASSAPAPERIEGTVRWQRRDVPWLSLGILGVIMTLCLFAELVMPKDPTFLHLQSATVAPNREFLFGTDTLGRDLFSCIWYGGRVSVFIGFFATLISTAFGVVYGTISATVPDWLDKLLMRLTEILLSIPGLLLILFVQAVLGKPNVLSVAVTIGLTSWCGIAKIVRTEVRLLRESDYVTAAKCMGGSFFYILKKHLVPNFLPSIMFMVVMNVRSAIGAEAMLSFLGMGLPLETVSWGSILSLAEKALLNRAWWLILIPGGFLVTLLMCITNVGNFLRRRLNPRDSAL